MIQPIRKDGIDAGPFRLNRITWHQHFNEALHEHAEARVVVLVAGDFYERFGARSRECIPGTGIYRTPCEPHFGSYSRDGGLYVSVNIPTEACGQPGFYGFPRQSAYDVRNPALALLGARLAAEVVCRDQWSPLAVHGLILESWPKWDGVTKLDRYQSLLGSTTSARCCRRTGDRPGRLPTLRHSQVCIPHISGALSASTSVSVSETFNAHCASNARAVSLSRPPARLRISRPLRDSATRAI